MSRLSITGRGWAYAGALLGGAVSIAANVAHSYVPPVSAPPAWTPQAGAVIGAVFWPVALFVAIEILARVDWPAGRRWVALRYLGLMPVAAVAAVVSYRHLSGLLAWYDEDPLTALVGPLAVDGLMVMATGALIATSRPVPAAERAEPSAGDPPADQPEQPAADTPDEASPKLTASAVKIAKVRRRVPAATQEEVARRAGVSVPTVKRHWPATAPAPAPTNGHTVPDLVTTQEDR